MNYILFLFDKPLRVKNIFSIIVIFEHYINHHNTVARLWEALSIQTFSCADLGLSFANLYAILVPSLWTSLASQYSNSWGWAYSSSIIWPMRDRFSSLLFGAWITSKASPCSIISSILPSLRLIQELSLQLISCSFLHQRLLFLSCLLPPWYNHCGCA